jgi:MYXO-CTERM domain-containing protein
MLEQDSTVCAAGPVVNGIDVSYHQQAIDWAKVKAAGIEFAFIRASDGSTFQDPKFATYWADSRAAGVRHGAYQLFRPAEDALAQADLLLSKIDSKLEPDDLPPVLDAEVTGNQTPAQIQAQLRIWVDRVRSVVGREPIILTPRSFWATNGSADFASAPLWTIDINQVTCPNIADAWPTWTFWQHSYTGRVDGITVDVALDSYNGDLASLDAFLGMPSACGDGTCATGENATVCPADCFDGGPIGPDGGVVDDGDQRFEVGGALNRVTTAGNAGDLMWAIAVDTKAETNFGIWHLELEEAGRYRVEAYTDTTFAQSKHAKYMIHAGDKTAGRIIDQTAINGWQSLGEYNFVAGADQWVHAGDNTGEASADNVQLVFDAIRLTRVPDADDSDDDDSRSPHGNCSAASGSTGAIWLLAIAGMLRRRRRR